MKTSNLWIFIGALFPMIGSADLYLVVSNTNQIPPQSARDGIHVVLRGSVDSNIPAFRLSGECRLNNSEHWYFSDGGPDISVFPALVDVESGCVVPFSTLPESTNALANKIALTESNAVAQANTDAGTNYIAAIVNGDAELTKCKTVGDVVAYVRTLRAALEAKDALAAKQKLKAEKSNGRK